MKLQSSPEQHQRSSDVVLGAVPEFTSLESMAVKEVKTNPIMAFSTLCEGTLIFNASVAMLAAYLDDHQGWFSRCASPMKVKPIGKNGYALVIGKFGSFGYEVEPQVGLEMKCSEPGMYTIESIPVPDADDLGYEVDFRSTMQLVEMENSGGKDTDSTITSAQWKLDLKVNVQFPQFIYALPHSLLQKTGDRLLSQIVKQVSHCLNQKVLKDFHTTYSRKLPSQPKRR